MIYPNMLCFFVNKGSNIIYYLTLEFITKLNYNGRLHHWFYFIYSAIIDVENKFNHTPIKK